MTSVPVSDILVSVMDIGILVFLIILSSTILGLLVRIIIINLAPKRITGLQDIISNGRYPQAINYAKKLLEKDPQNYDAHYLLGKSYELAGEKKMALQEYRIVNKHSIFSGICREQDFREAIASLYIEFGEEVEALKEYLLLIKLAPVEARYYYQAGQLFEKQNESNKAAHYYKQTIKYNPIHRDAYRAYGQVMYNAQNPAEAKPALEKAIELSPNDCKAHFYLGCLYKDHRNYRQAISSFDISYHDHEMRQASLIERGLCYMSLGNAGKAQINFEHAIESPGDDRESNRTLFARYFLSQCHEKLNNLEEALEQWEMIHQINKNFRDVPAKLNQYRDLKKHDSLLDFITASPEEFERICHQIIEVSGYNVTSYKPIRDGAQILAESKKPKRWLNEMQSQRCFRILRSMEDIDVKTLRIFQEYLQKKGIKNGYIITSADVTYSAKDYAKSRTIEVIDKSKLISYLKRMAVISKSRK